MIIVLKSLGKLIILIALKGHFITQALQPIQSASFIIAVFEPFDTSIHNLPYLLTGHPFLHSY